MQSAQLSCVASSSRTVFRPIYVVSKVCDVQRSIQLCNMFSMLPEAADFSLRTDRSAPRFEDQPFYQYNDLLIAQLEARMLADCTILGVYEALVVKMDGGAKDKARIKVLGPHGRRALHMYLDVHIKSEREDRGSSAKRPAADGDAASSTDIFQR